MSESTTIFIGAEFFRDGPQLVLEHRTRTQVSRSRVPIWQRSLTLRKRERRYCVGRFDLATFATEPCPEFAELTESNDERCRTCWLASGFNPAFYHSERLSPQQRKYNSEPHSVYLAYFSSNTLKGGISSERRLMVRLREQGALCAAVLATKRNAEEARAVEVAIVGFDGVSETVRASTKCKLLGQPFDSRAAFRSLTTKAAELAARRIPVDSSPRVLNFMPDYIGAGQLEAPLKDVSDEKSISGLGVALIGSLMIVQQGPLYFVANLKKYAGYEVEFSQTIEPYSGGPIQVGLPF